MPPPRLARMSVDATTVEEHVRRQLSAAFGGPRGIVEAAIPTVLFTITWIITRDLTWALSLSIGAAVVAFALRLIQRQTVAFVFNALIGILIAAIFAMRSGEAIDAFLPGIIYNAGYAVVLIFTILIGWPLLGFLVGSATGDPTGWRRDRAMVKLCSRLTWLLAVPCVLRVVVQYPLYVADQFAWLGTARIVMGWPLQVATLAAMVWVLSRNSIPMENPAEGQPAEAADGRDEPTS